MVNIHPHANSTNSKLGQTYPQGIKHFVLHRNVLKPFFFFFFLCSIKYYFVHICKNICTSKITLCIYNVKKIHRYSSTGCLVFPKRWGLCLKKIPHGWGNTRTLKCTINKVRTHARTSLGYQL